MASLPLSWTKSLLITIPRFTEKNDAPIYGIHWKRCQDHEKYPTTSDAQSCTLCDPDPALSRFQCQLCEHPQIALWCYTCDSYFCEKCFSAHTEDQNLETVSHSLFAVQDSKGTLLKKSSWSNAFKKSVIRAQSRAKTKRKYASAADLDRTARPDLKCDVITKAEPSALANHKEKSKSIEATLADRVPETAIMITNMQNCSLLSLKTHTKLTDSTPPNPSSKSVALEDESPLVRAMLEAYNDLNSKVIHYQQQIANRQVPANSISALSKTFPAHSKYRQALYITQMARDDALAKLVLFSPSLLKRVSQSENISSCPETDMIQTYHIECFEIATELAKARYIGSILRKEICNVVTSQKIPEIGKELKIKSLMSQIQNLTVRFELYQEKREQVMIEIVRRSKSVLDCIKNV